MYADNPVNRHLNRVGLPMGSEVVTKSQLAQIRNWLENKVHMNIIKNILHYCVSYQSNLSNKIPSIETTPVTMSSTVEPIK